MKILLGNFNAKVGNKNIFRPTFVNERLQQGSKKNGVRIVNFATSKNVVVKSMVFPHRNIHKCNRNSSDGKIHNHIDHVLRER
jgi:hypothetical protein